MVTTRPSINRPALIVEGEQRGIVVTDLHIGFENEFFRNNINIGKNTATDEIFSGLTEILDLENPDYLLLLGDVKSSIKTISKIEWNEIPRFLEKSSSKADTILVPGNHDANIQKLVPPSIRMTNPFGIIIENILFTHGHTMPPDSFAGVDKIVMGHIHPVFFDDESVLNGQRVWVSIKSEKDQIFPSASGKIEIIIVPSFNRYFYATHKNTYKKSISPIIQSISRVESAKIVTLDGTIIGNESMLSQVI